ncbi:MAG TPA: hypothetical protein VHN19_03560 [Burkholderiales bacterium]|nr:hypothetical protein [Burkholderiales bacterium]
MLAGAVALLGGCALPNPTKMERLDDIPEAMVAQLDAMPVLQDDRVPRVSIEEVEGVSCRRAWKGMPASWDDAVRRTKYRALQKGANAIADLSCERPQGRSFTTMCFESIRCTARAVKIGH